MRRALFAIALIPLLAGGPVVAAEAARADPAASPAVQMPSSTSPKPTKQVARRRSDRPAAPGSLSAAATYASEHSETLPIASPQRPTPPATASWTGFYVGAGVGTTQP